MKLGQHDEVVQLFEPHAEALMGPQRLRSELERPVDVAELGDDLGLCTKAPAAVHLQADTSIDFEGHRVELERPHPIVGCRVKLCERLQVVRLFRSESLLPRDCQRTVVHGVRSSQVAESGVRASELAQGVLFSDRVVGRSVEL